MADRSKGIGGTDIGAIIGVNPWKGPMDVYLEKIGITEGSEDNEAMYWGREMEPVLQKRYDKETGYETWVPRPEILPLKMPDLPWYLGSPDGLINPENTINGGLAATGGVDFKTTGIRAGWGQSGTDEVPEWIHTQADWYMGLTGAEWWDIAVLFFSPRREFAIYRIPRSQELIDNLVEVGKDFWENNVMPQIPPPLDASEGSKRLLNHLYPRDTEDLFAATAEIETLAGILKIQEDSMDGIIKDLTYTQNKLKEIIGDHAGVQTSLGKVTWRKNKDSEVVDWKAVAESVAEMVEFPLGPTIDRFTTIKPGSRIFRAWWAKEKV